MPRQDTFKDVECSQCHKVIKRRRSELRRTEHSYCSKECMKAFREKPGWKKSTRREAVSPKTVSPKTKEPNTTCHLCGKLFFKSLSQKGYSKFDYCSRSCARAGRRIRIKTQCGYCQVEFECPRYRAEKNANSYCCKECFDLAHASAMIEECSICGKPFTTVASRRKRGGRYCSMDCSAKAYSKNFKGEKHPLYKRIETTCDQCGETVFITPRRYETYSAHFCSGECADAFHSAAISGANHPFWTGGKVHYRGPNWEQQRKKARKRDGYKCQHCGKTEKQLNRQLDVHHVIDFKEFGVERYEEANQLQNLICLCQDCHRHAGHGNIPIQPKLL